MARVVLLGLLAASLLAANCIADRFEKKRQGHLGKASDGKTSSLAQEDAEETDAIEEGDQAADSSKDTESAEKMDAAQETETPAAPVTNAQALEDEKALNSNALNAQAQMEKLRQNAGSWQEMEAVATSACDSLRECRRIADKYADLNMEDQIPTEAEETATSILSAVKVHLLAMQEAATKIKPQSFRKRFLRATAQAKPAAEQTHSAVDTLTSCMVELNQVVTYNQNQFDKIQSERMVRLLELLRQADEALEKADNKEASNLASEIAEEYRTMKEASQRLQLDQDLNAELEPKINAFIANMKAQYPARPFDIESSKAKYPARPFEVEASQAIPLQAREVVDDHLTP